jgi:hypothetical protein
VTQKQQMFVIMSGMLITLLPYFTFPPNDMTFSNALHIAGANTNDIVNFSTDPEENFTFGWYYWWFFSQP